MKKLAYLFLAFTMGCATVNAQNAIEKVSLTYGDELPDDKQKIVKLIGEANGKIYGLGTKGKDDYVLKIFDSGSMKQLSSKPIVIPEINDKEVDFEDIFLLNGKLYAIGSVYQKKDKIFTLVASPLSDEGKLGKEGIILFKSQVAKKSDRGAFYFKQTQDENGLLVMHTALFDKEDAVKYEVKLFDDNLTAVFTNIEKVTFDDHKKDYEFTIADFDINYKDDVFLVINESYRDKKLKEKVERFEIHAFKSDKNYAKEVININLKDKEIINCSMLSTANNVIQLVGFYSSVRENGKANKELKGVYNATVDIATNTNTNLKFNEFDYATKVKLIGERRAKKGKDVKPYYNIHSIIEKNDGGLIILSEFQYVIYNTAAGIGPLALTQVTYIRNEIIVTSLKPDGSLEWSNVLPKAQTASTSTLSVVLGTMGTSGSFSVGMAVAIPFAQMGRGPEYLGCIPIYKNGQLNIMINDNVKNKGITDIEEIKSMGNYNNSVPSLFIFDNTGGITRKDPEEAIKNELVLRPGVFYRKSQNEYIVYSSRKKKDKLGRMILQD